MNRVQTMRIMVIPMILLTCVEVFAGTVVIQNDTKCQLTLQYTEQVGMSDFDFPEAIDAGATAKIKVMQKHSTFSHGEDYRGFVEYFLDCGYGGKGVYTLHALTRLLHGVEYVNISHKVYPPNVISTVPHNQEVGDLSDTGQISIKLTSARY